MSLNKSRISVQRALLWCAPIGCFVFLFTVLAQGSARDEYSSLRYPLSSLAIGPTGWIQALNFIFSGLLMVFFALGVRSATTEIRNSTWISRLIGMAGLGLIGAGIFRTDPVFGYPASEPFAIAQFTITGHLHDLVSLFVFICLPIAMFKFRNRFKTSGEQKWATYSMLSGIGMLLAFVLAGAGFKQTPLLVDIAGLLQRTSLIIGSLWLTLLAFYLLKRSQGN